MKHKFIVHKNCTRTNCEICDGGLAICEVCGLAEGCLTTDCPGVPSYKEHGDSVYAGKEDFINGEWVNKSSSYSPAWNNLPF